MSSGQPQGFRYQRQPVDYDYIMIVAQDEWKWRKAAEEGVERFMAKWTAAEKVRAGLRHAVVGCPNVTGRIKERIAQSKRCSCWFARHHS